MTDVVKVLGQSSPVGGTLTTLYTVPALTSVVLSSLMVTNRGTASAKYRISIAVAGAADATSQYIRYDAVLLPNEARTIVAGITLATTDVIRVQSDTGQVTFSAFGVQVT